MYGMKTVVLIGDSIRWGYEPTVRQELHNLTQVRGPRDNGGDSPNVLAHLDKWAIRLAPHVVHINCGLHDLKKEPGADGNIVPLDRYRENVYQILSRVKSETDARVIWASTTPVNQVWHHQNKPFDRFEADVFAYNDAAVQVARELDVPVNDLFAVVDAAGRDQYLADDGVHFTDNGYRLLGVSVAAFIKPYLKNG
jgi:lysophospholipase L1-like esterase